MSNHGATALAAMAVAITLLAISAAGAVRGTTEHPLASATELHKNGISGATYEATLTELVSIDPSLNGPDRLAKITTAFAKRIRHYWPAPNTVNDSIMYDWLENWFIAGRQRLEVAGSKLGYASIDIARMERRDWHSILQKGVGLCSQAALGIADYLDSQGLPARVIPLGGHVVAHTSAGGKDYVLDADYNVTFEVPSTKPSQWTELVRKAYGDAGHAPQRVEKIASIYRLSKADPIEAWKYVQPWRRTLAMAGVIKWAVPLALLAAGGLIFAKRRRTRTAVTA